MPRQAVGQCRFANAFRPADEVCVVHTPSGEFMQKIGLNGFVANQQRICTRGWNFDVVVLAHIILLLVPNNHSTLGCLFQ